MSIQYIADERVRSVMVEAFMRHLEQVPHSPGLFLDGYYYRPKHQDSLALAIDDATVALADLCSKIIAGEDDK